MDLTAQTHRRRHRTVRRLVEHRPRRPARALRRGRRPLRHHRRRVPRLAGDPRVLRARARPLPRPRAGAHGRLLGARGRPRPAVDDERDADRRQPRRGPRRQAVDGRGHVVPDLRRAHGRPRGRLPRQGSARAFAARSDPPVSAPAAPAAGDAAGAPRPRRCAGAGSAGGRRTARRCPRPPGRRPGRSRNRPSARPACTMRIARERLWSKLRACLRANAGRATPTR